MSYIVMVKPKGFLRFCPLGPKNKIVNRHLDAVGYPKERAEEKLNSLRHDNPDCLFKIKEIKDGEAQDSVRKSYRLEEILVERNLFRGKGVPLFQLG